mgnify:CR=1 FL=1
MAYDFIPQTVNDIKKAGVFGAEYESVYTYLSEKYNRKDPIALSKKPNEKRQIKVSRGFQSVTTIKDIQKAVKTDLVKLSFGEGSRGGRGVQNKGGQFEVDLTDDLETWWKDGSKYKSKFTEKVIDEMAKQYGWNKSKTFDVDNAGGLNQRRPLVFQGDQVYIGKAGDPYIGPTVTDITVKSDKGPVYLSLKATGTVTFFNAGVTKYLIADEMKKFNTIKNPQGKALLKMLGLNPTKLSTVFNQYGGKPFREKENVFGKMDKAMFINFLKSIGAKSKDINIEAIRKSFEENTREKVSQIHKKNQSKKSGNLVSYVEDNKYETKYNSFLNEYGDWIDDLWSKWKNTNRSGIDE